MEWEQRTRTGEEMKGKCQVIVFCCILPARILIISAVRSVSCACIAKGVEYVQVQLQKKVVPISKDMMTKLSEITSLLAVIPEVIDSQFVMQAHKF